MITNVKCPKCYWKPSKNDTWICNCDYVWNTFETAGVCPLCQKIHESTQCRSCKRYSPHLDWYPGLDKIFDKEIVKILEN